MSWTFNESDYDPNEGGVLPAGKYRVRIEEICPRVSRSGNDMWEMMLAVSGRGSKLWYYLVFMQDNPKMTNQKLGNIFDSFGITPGNMDFHSWIGKVGGAQVKHEEYNGSPSAKVHYFLHRNQLDALPAWIEPQKREGDEPTIQAPNSLPGLPADFSPISDSEDLPF